MGKKGNEGKAAVKENGYQTKLPQAFLNGFFLKFQTAVPDGKGQEEQNAKVYGSAAQDACKGASGAYFKDGRRDGARYYITGGAERYKQGLAAFFPGSEKGSGLGCDNLQYSHQNIAKGAVRIEKQFEEVQYA